MDNEENLENRKKLYGSGYFHGPRPDLTTFTRIPELSGLGIRNRSQTGHTESMLNSMCDTSGDPYCGDGCDNFGKTVEPTIYPGQSYCVRNSSFNRISDECTLSNDFSGPITSKVMKAYRSQDFVKLKKITQNENNYLVKASKIVTDFFKSSWALLATALFSEEVNPSEDILKYNGYTVRTHGTELALDSMRFNIKRRKFRLKLKLKNAISRNTRLEPKVILEINKWTIHFGEEEFIEITVPLGISPAHILYQMRPVEEFVIIECP